MLLILLAAAAWSIALGLRRAFVLSRQATIRDMDSVAAWVSAMSLVGAGVWAWQTRSWLALLAGYALGWAAQWLLPHSSAPRKSRRTA